MPSYTEIIFELGLQDQLVGVSSYSNWPAGTQKIEKVGNYYKPDIEKIYSLSPDIIFTGKWENLPLKEDFFKSKCKIIYIPQEKNVQDIYSTIKIISENLGKYKEGKKLIQKMKKQISDLKLHKTEKKVFIEIDLPLWTAGKNSFIDNVINFAGGENIFGNINNDYFKVNWENIVEMNPDIIISLVNESEYFYKLPLSYKINAIKRNKVYKLSEEQRDIISRPSPRIVKIIKELNEIFKAD